jgi:hypothetical protein
MHVSNKHCCGRSRAFYGLQWTNNDPLEPHQRVFSIPEAASYDGTAWSTILTPIDS